MPRRSNHDKFPFVAAGPADECSAGWDAIAAHLAPYLRERRVICVECYPGVFVDRAAEELSTHLYPPAIFFSQECMKTPAELRAILNPLLGSDRVFGRMNGLGLEDYFDSSKLGEMRVAVERAAQ